MYRMDGMTVQGGAMQVRSPKGVKVAMPRSRV